jgi:NAD(P)-dependent dehydrogenase (short-subunit alcohol dehydrogenase family)
MSKTIFITGASRGFGRIWTAAFLKRGDKVAATARDTRSLEALVRQYGDSILPIALDVRDRAAVKTAVNKAKEHFGSIDVVINNAGYGLFGTVEETSEQQARDQMETNFFGLLWVTQAVLPVMREQGRGHILQISSVLGLFTVPVLSLYNASKFAVEGLSESLAAEVKGFGINITLVEPAAFGTDWGGSSAVMTDKIDAYDKVRTSFQAIIESLPVGNPEATAPVILKLVDSEDPPVRLLMGKAALASIKYFYAERMTGWEQWAGVSIAAHGE